MKTLTHRSPLEFSALTKRHSKAELRNRDQKEILELLNDLCDSVKGDMPQRVNLKILFPIPEELPISSKLRKKHEGVIVDFNPEGSTIIGHFKLRKSNHTDIHVVPEFKPIDKLIGPYFLDRLNKEFMSRYKTTPAKLLNAIGWKNVLKSVSGIVAAAAMLHSYITVREQKTIRGLENQALLEAIEKKIDPNIQELNNPKNSKNKFFIPTVDNVVSFKSVKEIVNDLNEARQTIKRGQEISINQARMLRVSLEIVYREATQSEDSLQKRSSGWANNVRVFSSTSNSYSWDNRYLDHITSSFNAGISSFSIAHKKAFYALTSDPIYVSEQQARSRRHTIAYFLGNESAEKIISSGIFYEVPENSPNINFTDWSTNRSKGSALIIVGSRHPWEPQDRFTKVAYEFESALKKNFNTTVTLLIEPTPEDLKKHFLEMKIRGENTKDDQALVCCIGHGGASSEGESFEMASKIQGEFQVSADFKFSEKDLKGWVNRNLAPSYDSTTVVLGTCHSGVWQR